MLFRSQQIWLEESHALDLQDAHIIAGKAHHQFLTGIQLGFKVADVQDDPFIGPFGGAFLPLWCRSLDWNRMQHPVRQMRRLVHGGSQRGFVPVAKDDQLILPGHKLPFSGLPFRLLQMAENHESALDRLRAHLQQPRVAAECFAPLFKREIGPDQFGLALVEAVAHLNYLLQRGAITRELNREGAWLWQSN